MSPQGRLILAVCGVFSAIGVTTWFLTINTMELEEFRVDKRREIVEQSQQYADSHTAAFYRNLKDVKTIDVQLAQPDVTPKVKTALQSQKNMLEDEMRTEVAKIPESSRTDDMRPYTR